MSKKDLMMAKTGKLVLLLAASLLGMMAPTFPVAAEQAASTQDAALAEFKAAIRQKYDLKERAFHERDPETIVNRFYSPDAMVVTPGPVPIEGRAALLEAYRKQMTGDVRTVSYKTVLNGNMGLDWATFFIDPFDPAQEPHSLRILFIWEKREGEWWCTGYVLMPGSFPGAS